VCCVPDWAGGRQVILVLAVREWGGAAAVMCAVCGGVAGQFSASG
jgi:hypothetical protein